jgi:hypothetical protein
MQIQVSKHLVAELMNNASICGLPGPAKVKRLHGIATDDDLVHRKFHRLSPTNFGSPTSPSTQLAREKSIAAQ